MTPSFEPTLGTKHEPGLMPGTAEMATRTQLWPSPAPATPAPTEKKGQGGTEAVPEGRPERSHRGALGSVMWPSHPNPNTSFQQPAKGLALGTRVRDESNHSPLQEFTASLGTWKLCGPTNVPQGLRSAISCGGLQEPGLTQEVV